MRWLLAGNEPAILRLSNTAGSMSALLSSRAWSRSAFTDVEPRIKDSSRESDEFLDARRRLPVCCGNGIPGNGLKRRKGWPNGSPVPERMP
jgi:hypothetical protein